MSQQPHSFQNKWLAGNALLDQVERWRSEKQRVVFTNGVFDLLHPGHVAYLEAARANGDVLIVGLNSDESAQRLAKGPARPINSLSARAMVLAGLQCVDAVTSFEEDTPSALIELVRPDVLCKGGDYREDEVAGGEFVKAEGGRVVIIPFLEGFSTTAIERKILSANRKT